MAMSWTHGRPFKKSLQSLSAVCAWQGHEYQICVIDKLMSKVQVMLIS